jgi:hypothetical protein
MAWFRSGSACLGAVATVLALAAAPAAADTVSSPNWAGYVAHGRGVGFSRVSGAWRQPSATCVPGVRSYSSIWVGLGGYSQGSNRLEQIGTELDCDATGHASSTAWFELAPAPTVPVPFAVSPGDEMSATVTVSGHRVTMAITDRTSGRSFRRTMSAAVVDVASAEWILEAPSSCIGPDACLTQPLANFGATGFTGARARSTRGHTGAIADRGWRATRLVLAPARMVVDYRPVSSPTGSARPTGLSAGGSAFDLSFLR